MRYITAVANEQGSRVRYSDVVDLARAREENPPASRAYTQDVPGLRPAGFVAKAIGADSPF